MALGIRNSYWLVIETDFTVSGAAQRRQADKLLRRTPSARSIAFASQAEAECSAWGSEPRFLHSHTQAICLLGGNAQGKFFSYC